MATEQERIDLTAWIQVGAAAYVVRPARYRGAPAMTSVTIEKVLKRDVVASNGDRFSLNRPCPPYPPDKSPGEFTHLRATGRDYGGPILVSADDARIARWSAEVRTDALKNQAISAYETWRRTESLDDAEHAAKAFAAVVRNGRA